MFESARLADSHALDGFDCGKESLNTWLIAHGRAEADETITCYPGDETIMRGNVGKLTKLDIEEGSHRPWFGAWRSKAQKNLAGNKAAEGAA